MEIYGMRISAVLVLLVLTLNSFGQLRSDANKAETTIENAIDAFEDFANMGEDQGIPEELLEMAEGIVVFPKSLKIAFGVGGQGGRGFAMVKNEDGSWSNPFFIGMGEANLGAQIGVQSADIILVFMDRENILSLAESELTLGGDVGVAIGPVGRNSSAGTDIGFDAEIYSYSRSKGLYAGISVEGTILDPHDKMNEAVYDTRSIDRIFNEESTPYNSDISRLIEALERVNYSRL